MPAAANESAVISGGALLRLAVKGQLARLIIKVAKPSAPPQQEGHGLPGPPGPPSRLAVLLATGKGSAAPPLSTIHNELPQHVRPS